MDDLFVVVSMKSWVSEDFIPGLGTRKLIKDWGWEVPKAVLNASTVSWWMPAEHAARVQRAGFAQNLIAPGSEWLCNLPESITGRSVFSSTVSELHKHPVDRHVFIKPAEAKIEGFEAAWRTFGQTTEICDELNIPENSMVQWTDTLMDLDNEYRFYILDGKVQAGSQYLTGGITYYDGAADEKNHEARKFAEYALDIIENQPEAYTLDVGWNKASSSWVVIEGNPAWCSGLYGCDPYLALETIERSCNPTIPNDFLWVPDAFLVQKANKKILLPIR